MATSSAMSTSNQYIKYSIECVQNSQSVGNNTSNVTVRVRFWRTNTGYETYGTGTVYCKINGTTYSASVTSSQKITSSGITLFTKTMDIGHNSDGTKTLAMSAWMSHSQFSSSEQSYSQTLTTIPRTSSISLSSSSVNAGASVTVTISRASTSFKHDVYLKFGNGSWRVGQNVDTSCTFTVPMEVLNQIPSATSGTGHIECHTLNVGVATKSITISAPSSVVPSFSSIGVTRVDNGVPSSWGIYVRGKSKATLSISGASGTYGSSITRYDISGGGYSTTSSSFTTGTLNSSGTITFTAKVTDSRGRTASKTTSISVVDYYNPSISSFTAQRCTSSGTASDEGTYIKCRVNFSYASVSSKNTVWSKVRYKAKSSSTWSTEVNISNNTDLIIGGGSVSANSSYDVQVRVGDTFVTVEKTSDIPTAQTTLDLRTGGKGLAIGKVSEKDGFEVDWTAYFNKQAQFTNQIVSNRQGDGVTLLKFNTDRQWEFQQGGTGSGASLDLVSLVDSKAFRVLSPDKSKEIRMHVSNANTSISVDGNNVFHGGNCTTGTGTNQVWWRFDNGVQIVKMTVSKTINTTYQWGSLYTQGGAQTDLPNFAVSFSAQPNVHIDVLGNGNSLFCVRSQNATTTWAGSYECARAGSGSGYNTAIMVTAVGRWK